uniref:WASP actin nucleation promoting factor n=1 Tax=Cynoglossus semilaevis TaxID=244447 RepID=A0A3P8WUQ3_CYNSE
MSRGSKSKMQSSRSSLLSPQENEMVEELLGRRCASMATAVAQLFMALPHSPSTWSLQHTGVVCMVKDNPQRSYFIRMFDLKAGRQIWEQELYNQIVYSSPRPFFHTFPADDCLAGLNFAKEQEANLFQQAIQEKISQRNNSQEKKKRPLPPTGSPGSPGSHPMAMVDIQNPDIQTSRYRSIPSPSSLLNSKEKKKDKKKKNAPKLSKADIGAPSGFKHVTHVGWDPNNIDPDLWKLLSAAGISEAEMRDEKTSQLVYNVIEQSGGMEAVKREMNKGEAPPPPPSRGALPPVPGSGLSAPAPAPPQRGLPSVPPPMTRGGPPPPPPSSNRNGCPPPPPPSHTSPSKSSHNLPPPMPPPLQQRPLGPPPVTSLPIRGGGGGGGGGPPPPAPPPPPPPPPPLSLDFPPPPPPASSGSPVTPAPPSVGGGDGRGALLDQIRLGKKLRNVTDSPDSAAPTPTDSGEGIVGALMMVMQKRSKVIHSSGKYSHKYCHKYSHKYSHKYCNSTRSCFHAGVAKIQTSVFSSGESEDDGEEEDDDDEWDD